MIPVPFPNAKNVVLILFTIAPLLSFTQSLSLSEILNLYSLDSTAARQFCDSKKLNLSEAKNTGSTMQYKFNTPDSSVQLQIRYPNDSTSLNVQLNYWFQNKHHYTSFQKALKTNGFKKQSATEVKGTLPAYAERYVKNNQQIELIRPQGKQPYWLFLHPVGDYTW